MTKSAAASFDNSSEYTLILGSIIKFEDLPLTIPHYIQGGAGVKVQTDPRLYFTVLL